MVMAMIAVGGATRLTGSGLSIVEWKPIMGTIPPLNLEEWNSAFQKYQEYPQFKLQNPNMSLGDFKFIFLWEYFHRLLGRMMGVVFLLPWIYFVARKKIDRSLATKTAIGFFLGGLQGLAGWLMVQSGLVDRPSVSHFRLAIHLCLAMVILGYLFWVYLAYASKESAEKIHQPRSARIHLIFVDIFFTLQVIYGAFVAGLKAGFIHNTYPTMSGEWFPSAFFALEPEWTNFFENPVAVQFLHRWIAVILLIVAVSLALRFRKEKWSKALAHSLGLQFFLGVMTLIFNVPLVLAVLHQLGAAAFLMSLVFTHRSFSYRRFRASSST